MLLVDGQGRRTGYNPVTGQALAEIPGVLYYDATIVPPGATGIVPTTKALFMPENAAGTYMLEFSWPAAAALAAPADGAGPAAAFAVRTTGMAADYSISDVGIGGLIADGVPAWATLNFQPDGAPSQRLSVASITGSSVSGRVADLLGAPLEGATVTAAGPVTVTSVTGSNGRYSLVNLPPGRYTVTASLPAYPATTVTGVSVPPAADTINFVLSPHRTYLPMLAKR